MQVDQHQFHGLTHSAALIEAELRRRLTPIDLQPRQARVIEALGRMGRVSQVDLAREFAVTAASMSTMTERLIAAGYIDRRADPTSRRQNLLQLTDRGREKLAHIERIWSEIDSLIALALGHEADTFFRLARQLRDGLGGTAPGVRVRARRSEANTDGDDSRSR